MSGKIKHTEIVLIGYSGHGFVAADIFICSGYKLIGYCDTEKKSFDPYLLSYIGSEQDENVVALLKQYGYFIAIGDNHIRNRIYDQLITTIGKPVNAIHPSAVISPSAIIQEGVMIAANATINPLSKIGKGVICNTSCSIDHECIIEDFAHIAPGAVLCGNVKVGTGSFIGANAVVRQGVTIGRYVTIGAGSVVIKDVPDNAVMIGNPQKQLIK